MMHNITLSDTQILILISALEKLDLESDFRGFVLENNELRSLKFIVVKTLQELKDLINYEN